jgi:zinc protease
MKSIQVFGLTFLLILFLGILSSCDKDVDSFQINYEKYVLDNGLEVILHQDHSDPIVAVATLVHAGSNREKPGHANRKTGLWFSSSPRYLWE